MHRRFKNVAFLSFSLQLSFEPTIFFFQRCLVSTAWKRFETMLRQLFAPLMNGGVGSVGRWFRQEALSHIPEWVEISGARVVGFRLAIVTT